MPAVTADTTTLPKLPAPDVTARPRSVVSVTTAPQSFEGEGFPVRRAFAGVDLRHLDPFIHMDQMGEVDYAPYEPKGTDWHPHRGFETVTYIIDGTFQHQDSHGGGGADHQRRHAVDDRRVGHPAHRDAAGGARRQRRPVPRHPAVGEPAVGGQDDRAALPEPRGRPVRAAVVARRWRAGAADRRRRRRPRRPGQHAHADHPRPRHRRAGRPAGDPVAHRLQRPRLRARRVGHGRRRAPAGDARSAHRVRRRRHDRRSTAPAASRSRCCCSAAARSASPSPPTARS